MDAKSDSAVGTKVNMRAVVLWVLIMVALVPLAFGRGDRAPLSASESVVGDVPGTVATPLAGLDEEVVPAPMDVGVFDLFSGGLEIGAASGGGTSASSVEDVLEKGLRLTGASPVHLAIRGTVSTGSVRCEWRGVARTVAQRETAIRFWLELEDGEALPSASEVERRFILELDRIEPEYPDTVISNFRSIASGGLSTEYEFLTCYVDYRVDEYIVGTGSVGENLTVAYDRMGESRSYELYKRAVETGEFGDEVLMTEGEYARWRRELVWDVESVLGVALDGREGVVFLAPMGAHNTIAVEAWQAVAQWDVQTVDGVVNVVRYGAGAGDLEHTQTLSRLKTRIRTALGLSSGSGGSEGVSGQAEPESSPSGGASGQSDSSSGLGGVSSQASSTTSASSCPTESSSSASAFPATVAPTPEPTRIASVGDLRGYYQSIGAYCFIGPYSTETEVSASSSPSSPSVSGILSGQAGFGRTTPAPATATPLPTFVPSQPPAVYAPKPDSLTATASGQDRANLTWTGVTNATGYTVQHRESSDDDSDDERWRTASASVTGTSYRVTGLWCGKEHEFRVGAYGNGTSYNGRAGLWSATVTATMGACTAQRPMFESASYSFDAHTALALGGAVGKVSAYDVNGDTVTYSIIQGNSAGKFAIRGSTGEITVAGSLGTVWAGSTYALTVGASDGVSGTTIVTVNVSVVSPTCRSGVAVTDPRSNYWLVRDCEMLLGAKDTLRGTGALNWSAGTAMTSWDGLTVGGAPKRVVALRLDSRSLTGSIPSELGLLSELTVLNLHGNSLSGSIPSELGALSGLTHLRLSRNSLTGSIPPELGRLSALTYFRLSRNSLTGSIPPELGALANVTYFNVAVNGLTEGIPPELGNLSSVDELWLKENPLGGLIPPELGNLSNLTRLEIYDNNLTGNIPSELGRLSNLTRLVMYGNNLTGNIPSELGNLENLQELHLQLNNLTGNIPSELGRLSNLTRLAIDDNNLTGNIPSELGNLENLQELYLHSNNLSGCVPSTIRLSRPNLFLSVDVGLRPC